MSNNTKSGNTASVVFIPVILYCISPSFSIIGVIASLYNLKLARFIIFIATVDVLLFIIFIATVDVLSLILPFPILATPFSPTYSDIINVVVYCIPWSLLFDIFAPNSIGSISCPDITPFIYHTSVVVPSSFSVISGSVYSSPPLLLLPSS